jgi:hypothetical protein
MFRPFFSATCLISIVLPLMTSLSGCHSSTPGQTTDTATPLAKRKDLPTFKRNPEWRAQVKKGPVAEYKVRTDDKLNEQYFSVRLFETTETMKYLAKVDYEGLPGEDTITLPDIGITPRPALQKGPERYSCIVGLMDNDKGFRELKKIYVTDRGKELKITTLKHYRVTEAYRLEAE